MPITIANDLHARRLAPDKDRVDHPVQGERGLALRVSPDGTKTWSLRYRRQADGKLRRLTLGQYPDVSLAVARERARVARSDVSAGNDPAGSKQERRAADTFAELAMQWVAFKRRQGRAASYLSRAEQRVSALPGAFTERKVNEMTRAHVTAALDAVAARGVPVETNRVHALISAVCKWAASEGLAERDPSHGVKRRFDELPRERVMSDDELGKFWHGIDTLPASAGAKIAMRLCMATGQRPKEIAHLRRDKLALDALHPTMTIPRSTAKNRTEHVVPLPMLAVGLIRQALELAGTDEPEWLFPSPTGKGPIDPHAFAKIIDRARDKNDKLFGLDDVTLYDCKRTMATWLGNEGHPDQFIGLLLNHLTAKKGSVTGKHYNHATYMVQKRAMIESWSKHLEGVIGVESAASNVVDLTAKRGA